MRRSGRTSSGELVWGGGVPWAGNSGVGADGWRVLGLSEVWVRRLVSVLCCLCVAWLCNGDEFILEYTAGFACIDYIT